MTFDNASGTFQTFRKLQFQKEDLEINLEDFDRTEPRQIVFPDLGSLERFNDKYFQWERDRDAVRDQLAAVEHELHETIETLIGQLPERNKYFVLVDDRDVQWLVGWRFNETERGTNKIKSVNIGWVQLVIMNYEHRNDQPKLAKWITDRVDY